MKPPGFYQVNGYDVTEISGSWEVWNSDERVAGPFDTEQEAVSAARSLPPKG